MPTQPEHQFNEDSLRDAIIGVWGEFGAHIDVYDHLVKLAHQTEEFREHLSEVVAGDPAFEDPRIGYVEVQVDTVTWKALKALKANGELG